MRQVLQERFNIVLRNNGNSFNSCFQFLQAPMGDQLTLRIKIYNKFLAFLTSESA